MTLIPQRRVDKNGKVTTRHVRAETYSPVMSPLLPAPAMVSPTSAPDPREAATEAWRKLESAGMKFSSATIPNLAYVASKDTDMIQAVVERYVGGASLSERALWQGMITFTELYPRDEHEEENEAYLASYRSGLDFFDYMGRLKPFVSGRTLDHYRTAAQYFSLAADMVPDGLDSQDRDALKAVLLVMRVEDLKGEVDWEAQDYGVISLDHMREDIRFLAENMHKVEPVLEGLLEMLATDRQAVETLNATQSSLRDGAL